MRLQLHPDLWGIGAKLETGKKNKDENSPGVFAAVRKLPSTLEIMTTFVGVKICCDPKGRVEKTARKHRHHLAADKKHTRRSATWGPGGRMSITS